MVEVARTSDPQISTFIRDDGRIDREPLVPFQNFPVRFARVVDFQLVRFLLYRLPSPLLCALELDQSLGAGVTVDGPRENGVRYRGRVGSPDFVESARGAVESSNIATPWQQCEDLKDQLAGDA